jgi:hypothetical protein
MNLLDIETNGRKNIAIWMMFGGSLVFTLFSGIALWMLSTNLAYVFYLALAAHVQILVIMTGFTALLVKRRISVSKDGASIEDSTNDPNTATTG